MINGVTFSSQPDVPAREWNRQFVDRLPETLALQGAHTLLTQLPQGRVLSLRPSALWRHPWFTDPRWDPASEQWAATVKPGFVNGLDPIVPGVGELIDDPVIPLGGFRTVGRAGDTIPPFFAALGAQPPPELEIQFDAFGSTKIDITERAEPDLPPRKLVACEIYIAMARPTFRFDMFELDGSGVSGTSIFYSVTYDTATIAREGQRPRLLRSPGFVAPEPPTLYDRLAGDYEDDGEDRLPISTVYLLGPPNQLEATPDATWEPYVRHNAAWNISYAWRNVPPPQPPDPIRLFTGLGYGLGDMIGNQMLAPGNEEYTKIINALNTVSTEGRFWSS